MSSSLRADQLDTAPLELGDPEPSPAPAPKTRPRWLTPSSWTLRSKLVASMLVLFAVVSIITGAATVLYLKQVLTSQVDQQLMGSISRIRGFGIPTGGRGGPGDQGLTAALSIDG